MSAPDRDAVLRLLARERLSIDAAAPGRTTFLSHLGAAPKLVPGPWIGHRELLLALALQNLTPEQRRSLAQAVLVDYEREFGVGRLVLRALASDLPFGGASLSLRPRSGGPHCLYTWALGPEARPIACEWLLLRAQPEWALEGARPLRRESLGTLQALEAGVVVFVPSAVAARQVVRECLDGVPFTAHPRFLPLLDGADPTATIALWPHDAVGAPSLARRTVHAAVVVDAPEPVSRAVRAWADARGGVEVSAATCPGRVDRAALRRFWEACERPSILLRGDPTWTGPAEAWLGDLGAHVERQSESTQLGLF